MNKIWSVLKTGIYDACRNLFSLKGIIVCMALFFFNYIEVQPVAEFATRYDEPLVPVVMPFLFYSLHFQLMFGLITVFLFADVPFLVRESQYVLQRTGRKRWVWAKIVQIVCTAVLYMIMEAVISVLICSCDLEWKNHWGTVWKTLSLSDMDGMVMVPRNVLIRFTPVEAMIRVEIMGIGVVTFIGLFMFFVSLVLSNVIAVVGTGMISVLPYVVANTSYFYSKIYYLSPMSWIGIIEYSESYIYGGPTGVNMLEILLGLMCMLVICIMVVINRVDLIVKEET